MDTEFQRRFWAKVDRSGPVPDSKPEIGGCWLWVASCQPSGYGQIRRGKTTALAHRVAYELLVGPIGDGLDLDHLCRVRSCVNPAHLEPVTRRENARRGLRGVLLVACPKGHPYSDQNTYICPDGSRRCRTCHRIEMRRRNRKVAA